MVSPNENVAQFAVTISKYDPPTKVAKSMEALASGGSTPDATGTTRKVANIVMARRRARQPAARGENVFIGSQFNFETAKLMSLWEKGK